MNILKSLSNVRAKRAMAAALLCVLLVGCGGKEPAMTDTQSVGSTATDEVVSTGLAPDLPNVDYGGTVKHRCPEVFVVYECEYAVHNCA